MKKKEKYKITNKNNNKNDEIDEINVKINDKIITDEKNNNLNIKQINNNTQDTDNGVAI